MRTTLRALAVLAAALLVVAGLFAFRQSSYGQSLAASGLDRGAFSQAGGVPPGAVAQQGSSAALTSASASAAPASFSGRGPESRGPSVLAVVELLKNLAIIAVSVTLIALGTRMTQRGRQRGSRPVGS